MEKRTHQGVWQPVLLEGAVDVDRVVLSSDAVGVARGVRMPEPEVRESLDGGAIHWQEQVGSGLPDAHGGPDSEPTATAERSAEPR